MNKFLNWMKENPHILLCSCLIVGAMTLIGAGVYHACLHKPTDTTEVPEQPAPETAAEENPQLDRESLINAVTLDHSYLYAADYIAKTVYGEARGCPKTEQAAVIWCILNRVDQGDTCSADYIVDVVTAPNQFHGFDLANPITEDIMDLTLDVLKRWMAEKNGILDSGRVLPKEYLYFYGDGTRNHFTSDWRGNDVWDWRLDSPYEV